MKVAVAEQVIWFGQSIALGVLLGMIYDIFRVARIMVKSTAIIIFIEDIIFFFICGLITFIFMMEVSQGQIRAFIIIGEIMGGVLYRCTVSVPIMATLRIVINVIKKVVELIYEWTIKPIFKIIIKQGTKVIRLSGVLLKKYGKSLIYPLKYVKNIVYNLLVGIIKYKEKGAINEGEE